MKNRHWFRLAGWLLTLVMLLMVIPAATFAEDNGGNSLPSEYYKPTGDMLTRPAEVDITASTQFAYTDNNGKAVTVDAMNPNIENRVTLTVSGLNGNQAIVKETVMTVTLPEDIKITSKGLNEFSNDAVSASVTDGKLYLSWKGDKQDAVTATFAVLPQVKTENDLRGRFVLGTAHKAILGTAAFMTDNRYKLNASHFEEKDGKIYPITDEDPVWVLTHVSGDYYTVRSERTGQYIYISPTNANGYKANSLYLVSGDEETAQKILVKDVGGGYYSFSYNNYAINNSSNTPAKGFGCWTYGGGANEKFKLYPVSALGHEPTKDISGTWTVYNEQQKTVLNVNDNAIASVRYKFKNGTEIFPNSDTVKWTFEHINRDWYTIKAGDKYLNVSDKGVSVSSTAQHLLIKSDNNFDSIVISNGEFDTVNIAFALNAPSYSSFNSAKTVFNNNTKFKLTESVSDEQFDISGEWAIITPSSGAVMLAKASGSNKLASSTFVTMGDGTIYTDAEASISWILTKEDGNWYSVRTQDGKYLSIKDSAVSLSDEKTLVYIQKDNNQYRITNGSMFGLNNSGNNANNGYGGYNSADLNSSNEWHELKIPSAVTSILCFDVNGGDTDATPEIIYGAAGEAATLPDLNATKDGQNFLGWAETNNIYVPARGLKHTYHNVYLPGMSYTMNNGKHTLYAVYNTIDRNVQFGIRRDGVIVDEPNDNNVNDYIGHFTKKNILKTGYWVIDIDATKPVEDYYVNNNVIAALNSVPSAEEIAAALKKEGNVDFDPETQYIHYYVLKYATPKWKVDGVIRNKEKVGVTYNANVPGTEKTLVKNLPGGEQVVIGSEILVGTNAGSTDVLRPSREGYLFTGWNTEPDGSGISYSEGHYVKLTENLNLYAQWMDIRDGQMVIFIHSDWPDGKLSYVGARITLTAELTGFEGREYTLQWQYAVGDSDNWIDIAGANNDTYIFTLDEINTHYNWRCVARDVR